MRIRWTDGAVTDLTRICDYVEEHAGAETARRIALSGHQQIEALKRFPSPAERGGGQTPASLCCRVSPISSSIAFTTIQSKYYACFMERSVGLNRA